MNEHEKAAEEMLDKAQEKLSKFSNKMDRLGSLLIGVITIPIILTYFFGYIGLGIGVLVAIGSVSNFIRQ